MKTDDQLKLGLEELKTQKEEVQKAFLLLGFKGRLSDFFTMLWNFISDITDSKLNKTEHKVFSGADYLGEGTDTDPYRIKFPEIPTDETTREIIQKFTLEHEGMKGRIKQLEDYIRLLQDQT